MSEFVIDLQQYYQRYFGTKPKVGVVQPSATEQGYSVGSYKQRGVVEQYVISGDKVNITSTPTTSKLIAQDSKGVEIWLPTWFEKLPPTIGDKGTLFLPYSVIRISGSANVIRTPLNERTGSVKEFYSIDDYKITIKGFFIDKETRIFPESDLIALRQVFEAGTSFTLTNALTNPFLYQKGIDLREQNRVVMASFELPEVEGGRKHVRPFVMQLESDSIFTLEIE